MKTITKTITKQKITTTGRVGARKKARKKIIPRALEQIHDKQHIRVLERKRNTPNSQPFTRLCETHLIVNLSEGCGTPPNTNGGTLYIKTRRMNRKIITNKNTATPTTQSLLFAITAMTLLTLLTPLTHADASLGSTFSAKDILLSPGQQKIIEVTFFNTGSTNIDLYIEQITHIEKTSGISDIKVYIMQKNINILVVNPALTLESLPATKTPKKDPGTTWIVLGKKGDLYIPAKKVYFLIEVPDKQTYANDRYSLTFRARTQNTNTIEDSAAASIGQLREFPVTVTIQNIVPNPKYADQNSPWKPPKKTYKPITKTTTTLPEPANNQQQPDTNDNYINNNYTPKDDTTKNNPYTNTKNISSTQDTNTTISNTETQDTGIKDRITGLVTGNTPLPKSAYNILTIIIILIGIFTLYRIARH